ncbi:hypothetical protein CR513_32241, partial [Mucuna pruriens]
MGIKLSYITKSSPVRFQYSSPQSISALGIHMTIVKDPPKCIGNPNRSPLADFGFLVSSLCSFHRESTNTVPCTTVNEDESEVMDTRDMRRV